METMTTPKVEGFASRGLKCTRIQNVGKVDIDPEQDAAARPK